MPVTATKNLPLSMAATDLGLGDMLQSQLQEQETELKKKKAALAPQAPLFGAASLSLLGPNGEFGG